MKPMIRRLAVLGSATMLQACAGTDPLLNANDWHPTGANARNIAAEVVRPGDLVYGREPTEGSDGALASAAVQRLRTNHVKPLPDSGITDLRIQSSPTSAGSN